ncbi:FmdB family transcriptional regulator [Rathayibacter toxicus]|nr:FmdB family zinc ribbon protein [Rathayibacter toxicus]QWL30713.1 FmdB family transcriptional regulator [Rathayibacter toxicus]
MPTYSYRCTQCSSAFDVQQAFTDDSLTECTSCHGALRKVFSAVGVTFNGSGFYRTDSRASETSQGASKVAEAAPATARSSGSGSSGNSSPTQSSPSSSSATPSSCGSSS